MPLSSANVTAQIRFALTKAVEGWESTVQGENEILLTLAGLDLEEWSQAYALFVTLDELEELTIDLQDVTNLVEEEIALSALLAMAVAVTGDPGAQLTIEPGDADGLTWFWGSGLSLNTGEGLVFVGDQANGFPVVSDGKNVKLTNTGTVPTTVRLIFVGQSLPSSSSSL